MVNMENQSGHFKMVSFLLDELYRNNNIAKKKKKYKNIYIQTIISKPVKDRERNIKNSV